MGIGILLKQLLKQFYFKKIKKWDNAQIRLYHLRRCGMSIGERTYIYFQMNWKHRNAILSLSAAML